jgi:haloalkane dehalogenase
MASSDFNYTSNYVDVQHGQLHYIEAGEGDPVIFMHGIPTWCYLWRNIIPYIEPHAHCIAYDLMGCGRSDKPDISYTLEDHINHFTEMVSGFSKPVTLVMHGWGSVIGFHYAQQHPKNIKGLAFLEAHLRAPTGVEALALPWREVVQFLSADDAKSKILESNFYVENVLRSGVIRPLEAEELAHYLEPFEKNGSRRPIWQYLQEIPVGGGETAAFKLIAAYSQWLQTSNIPKLLLFAVPGFMTTIETVCWAREQFPKLTCADIGEALHYAQESVPASIGTQIADWYKTLNHK